MSPRTRGAMLGRFRIGRILGFDIHVDYSWFLILILILWTFTAVVFPAQYPDLETAAYVGMGVAGALLFFLSLLLHELSHSVVARSRGIPVGGITLFVFGGMAEMQEEASTPGDEFAVAIVGPIASFVIGGLFWGIALAGRALEWGDPVVGVAAYLALLNIVLAVFNLLPGFPMDGGRVFRAIVWKVTRSLGRATRVASAGGRWVGYLLMALGVLQLFARVAIGGIWLIFIGWFVRTAAISGYTQHVLRDRMSGMTVQAAMTPDPETVPPDLSLQEVVDNFFLRKRHHTYPVVGAEGVEGIVTLGRVKEIDRGEWGERSVRDASIPLSDEIVVDSGTGMDEVLDRMGRSDAQRFLVMDGDQLLGIVTARDLLTLLERRRELESLR